MNLPHVYHFLLDHRVGGPHVYADTLRQAMDGKLVSSIVTTGCGPMTEHALLNIRHVWAPLYAMELIVNILLLTGWLIFGKIKRRGTMFAVHGGANLAPLIAARLFRIPVVWHFHETTARFAGLVDVGKWVLKGGRYAVAVVANKSTETYGLDDAVFLPASVDPIFWSRDAVHERDLLDCGWMEECDGGPRPFRILAVGNLNPLKGMDVLLDALADIPGPWHLKIVGAPLSTHREYGETLRQLAGEVFLKNKSAQVDFVGWQDKKNIRALLASCNVFILPSRSEACPIALLEAMAMGCRCIATDVGDVRLIMEGSPLGKIIPAESVDACREAVLEMYQDYANPGSSEIIIGVAWQLPVVVAKTEALYFALLRA